MTLPTLTTTAYFPPLTWFVHALTAGSWQWEAQETYQKGGWRNRCRILTANGPLLLSVPLRGGKHQQMPIREVLIDARPDWRRQHAQAIRSAYGRSPYFEHYVEVVLQLLQQQHDTLWDYNLAITRGIIQLLDLPLSLSLTTSFRGGAAGATQVEGGGGLTSYPQVFADRFEFVNGLSVLDGLFCLGPELSTTFTPWQT
ncbi:WbqC family protein [Neolewinella sp.]|uniref:WbqC family protein n=1 Tax=Neolewinella sp. TaxID=2993543 RepID=UPI003B516DA4